MPAENLDSKQSDHFSTQNFEKGQDLSTSSIVLITLATMLLLVFLGFWIAYCHFRVKERARECELVRQLKQLSQCNN